VATSHTLTARSSEVAVVTRDVPFGEKATEPMKSVCPPSDPQAALPANTTFTAADQGVDINLNVTLKTAGSQSLTVTDTSNPSVTGTETSLSVSPAAASHFIISGPSSVAAGAAFNIIVTALDPFGNIVTSYLGTVAFTSSDRSATLPRNTTFTASDRGVHTFTRLKLRTRGRQTITVTDTRTHSILGSLTITVT
jgi:hypothetical protein